MQSLVTKNIALSLAAAMLSYTLGGCGTSTGASRAAERYASLPYADAATFAAPQAEAAAALATVLTTHGYAIIDTTGGTIKGLLTTDRKLQPSEYFGKHAGSPTFLGIVLGIVLLIPLIASLFSHASDEESNTAPEPETPALSYHYVVTATLVPLGEESADLSLAFDELEYAGDDLAAATPIEDGAFTYALFDALQEELNANVK